MGITIRTIPKETVDIVKHFEGLHLKAYICPAGLITVGWGHVLSFIPAVKLKSEQPDRFKELMATKITREQAEAYLQQDLRLAGLGVLKLTSVALTEGQYGALVSFVFNLGAGKYRSSTLRMKINRGEFEDASEEFHKWVYGGGVKLKGLIKRRKMEAELFLKDM